MEVDLPLHDAAEAQPGGHAHPPTTTYVKVGLFLAVITAVEVGIVYVKSLRGVLVPLLMVLAAVKFGTVAGFFMHLKFDNKVLSWIFSFGLFVTVIFILALMYMLST